MKNYLNVPQTRVLLYFLHLFDESAVDLLDSLKTPAFKVASFELTDLPLMRYIASKKKPILISTGMGSLEEIEEAVSTIKECNNQDIYYFTVLVVILLLLMNPIFQI